METFVTLTTRWRRVSTFANSHSKQGESFTNSLWTGYIATFKTNSMVLTLAYGGGLQFLCSNPSASIVCYKCLFINAVIFICNLVNDEQVIDNCNNLSDMTSICN